MTTADRYALLAKLPDAGPFTRYLAIERGAVPRAVVVSATPSAIADAPAKLDALVRDTEAAARLRHPNVLPSLGLETLGEGTALVEAYRAGVTLRELLAAGGRLPAPIAARIAADLCAALQRIHGFPTGDGRPLAHGKVGAEHVWIAEGGEALLCGLGLGAGTDTVDDVRGAAAVLGECLSGEALSGHAGGERFDAPGVPAAVASVVSRYRGAASAILGPAALGEAVAAAVKPGLAPREALAAWVDAVLPPGQGIRSERSRLLEEALGPEARFGGAAAGSRGKQKEEGRGTPAPVSPEDTIPAEEIAVDQIIDQASLQAKTVPMLRAVTDEDILAMMVEPTPVAIAAPTTPPGALPADAARTFPTPARGPAHTRFLAIVAGVCALVGFLGGFAISLAGAGAPAPGPPPAAPVGASPALAPVPVPASPAPAPVRREPARATKAAKREPRPAASVPASPSSGAPTGVLTVTAPEGATVLLDGKPLGVGSFHREIPAGPHRVEIRHDGAKVSEAFEMAPGGTYTYEVTPTAP